MKRYALSLDLKDDAGLISAYEQHHQHVWPEIIHSIRESGILNMEIYRHGIHLFMILETEDSFDFRRKAALDESNPKVVEWENLMWKYQAPWSGGKQDMKWVLIKKIFDLAETL
jgi:L-rhamnose mutarotase